MSNISDQQLAEFSRLLSVEMGLHFPPERWPDLRRTLQSACGELGFGSAERCLEALLRTRRNRRQIEILAAHLTVGETYFMREAAIFDALKSRVWPALLGERAEGGRHLRIWSAGCSSGEEPYSIAMFIREQMPELHDWHIDILATDINVRALGKAGAGIYREWSFRGTPAWVKEKYFTSEGPGTWRITPLLQRMVRFSYLNLAEDVFPTLASNTNAMDVIFCRNVLMYFLPSAADRVIEGFHQSLVEGGSLVVSACESSMLERHPFTPVPLPGTLLFRKASAPPPVFQIVVPEVAETDQTDLSEQSDQPAPAAAAPEDVSPEAEPAAPSAAALLGQARDCANRGHLAEALERCEEAVRADKLEPRAHFLMANILQEQGRREEARAALRRVLFLEPEFILAHFTFANLARQEGALNEADAAFQTALRLVNGLDPETVLPESEGITARRLKEIILLMREASIGT